MTKLYEFSLPDFGRLSLLSWREYSSYLAPGFRLHSCIGEESIFPRSFFP